MAKAAAQMVREAEEREELALQAKQHVRSFYLPLCSLNPLPLTLLVLVFYFHFATTFILSTAR